MSSCTPYGYSVATIETLFKKVYIHVPLEYILAMPPCLIAAFLLSCYFCLLYKNSQIFN